MSRNFEVLEKAALATSLDRAPGVKTARTGEYSELIRRLFDAPSAVAIIGSRQGEGVSGLCQAIAIELAACGKRVVVVAVDTLLRRTPLPSLDETESAPSNGQNVWLWPSAGDLNVKFSKSSEAAKPGSWIESLRRNFDSVLLDCPPLAAMPGSAQVSAMADSAVLVVEAGRTSKQQIQRDQRTLRMRGANLAGCILIERR
jgi:Mrp family chromosome partitioning ATPase